MSINIAEWEKFRGGQTLPNNERVHATIGKTGIIFINKNLHRLWGKPAAVYLYFNRAKDQIALEPTSPRLPEAFHVKEKNGGWFIHASPFCRHFGIKLDTTHMFARPDLSDDGKLLLDLSNLVKIGGIKRKRRK